MILRIPARPSRISPTGLSPSPVRLSSAVPLSVPALPPVLQPRTSLRQLGLDCSAFARHYSRNPLFSSGYLDVSLPRVPRCAAISSPRAAPAFPRAGFPIRRPAAQCLTTTPRSFSQWYTSFLGLWRQGILRMPFVAYPAVLQSNDLSGRRSSSYSYSSSSLSYSVLKVPVPTFFTCTQPHSQKPCPQPHSHALTGPARPSGPAWTRTTDPCVISTVL